MTQNIITTTWAEGITSTGERELLFNNNNEPFKTPDTARYGKKIGDIDVYAAAMLNSSNEYIMLFTSLNRTVIFDDVPMNNVHPDRIIFRTNVSYKGEEVSQFLSGYVNDWTVEYANINDEIIILYLGLKDEYHTIDYFQENVLALINTRFVHKISEVNAIPNKTLEEIRMDEYFSYKNITMTEYLGNLKWKLVLGGMCMNRDLDNIYNMLSSQNNDYPLVYTFTKGNYIFSGSEARYSSPSSSNETVYLTDSDASSSFSGDDEYLLMDLKWKLKF